VYVIRGKPCTNDYTVYAFGEISFVSLEIAPNARSGHAVAEGTITNIIDGNPLNVSVDVSFVLTGDTYNIGQPPTDGAPVHAVGANGEYEGVVSVNGDNFLDTDGTFFSLASLTRWTYLMP
jgi:hypothetical protein